MKINQLFYASILTITILLSCDEEGTRPKSNYETGVFVANEGGFGKSTASVTFYDQQTQLTEQNIFIKPPLSFAGDVLQSITFDSDLAYLVLNGSNKIEVVNATSFESVGTISNDDIFSPRYLEVIDNKAYISVWGPYDENFSLVDSYVLVIDLSTNTVVKKIDTDEGSENMLVHNNKLFVANYNYGSSNTVAVIDATNNSLVDQIEVGAGPAGMVIDKNGKLWVLCVGAFLPGTAKLVQINPTTLAIEKEIALDVLPGNDLAISPDGISLIYYKGTDVYKISIEATTFPTVPLFSATNITTPYALSVDPVTGDIWLADAVDYASEGKAYIYSSSGVFTSSYTVGINPGQFIFR
jgi:YVTN family beta-propeller protein